MRVAVFSAKAYDIEFTNQALQRLEQNSPPLHMEFFETNLNEQTVSLAQGFDAVCVFVNDEVNKAVLEQLSQYGIQAVALRCAGFNNVDLKAAKALNIAVVRVPAYSPYAVAEHTLALILTLNRGVHRAYHRVREGNFSLNGLLGFDLHGKTVGIIGTGKIGQITAQILQGFGCNVLGSDPYPTPSFVGTYVEQEELFQQSDIISLHCPLTPETHHLINGKTIAKTRPGVMIINTSRGALIDTQAVIDGLKSEHIGYLGIDVYEEEGDLFFEDLSNHVIKDDRFSRLLTFPNVLITGHQAFFTREAVHNIVDTTLANLLEVANSQPLTNAVLPDEAPTTHPATAAR